MSHKLIKQFTLCLLMLVVTTLMSFCVVEFLVLRFQPLKERIETECTDSSGPSCERPSHPMLAWLLPGEEFFELQNSGWKVLPNRLMKTINWSSGKVVLEIASNDLGFRGPQLSRDAQQRILFLGDSVTFGLNLSEEETYVRVVENRLRESGYKVDAINAGVPSNDLASYSNFLSEIMEKTTIDVIVLNVVLNDMSPCCAVRMYQPPRFLERSMFAQRFMEQLSFLLSQRDKEVMYSDSTPAEIALWQQEVAQYFQPSLVDSSKDKREFANYIQGNNWHFGLSWSQSAWTKAEKHVRRIHEIAFQHGAKLLVVMTPLQRQVEYLGADSFPQEQLRVITEKNSIAFLDLLPHLRQHSQTSEGGSIFLDGIHLNGRGNHVVAEQVFPLVVKSLGNRN